jgi:hypothetical protein
VTALWIVLLGWVLVAAVVSLGVGRAIRVADDATTSESWTVDVERFLRQQSEGTPAVPGSAQPPA